jgi:CheY-like chemotaxis protein
MFCAAHYKRKNYAGLSRLPLSLERGIHMATHSASLSVLVIDDDAQILSFFARILHSNGIRALLARNAGEAIGIAKRGYVPIDLVLTDVVLKTESAASDVDSGPELVDRIRHLRPEVRALYMSAYVDSEVIRIELVDRGFHTTSKSADDGGLIGSIWSAAARPMVQMAGSRGAQ